MKKFYSTIFAMMAAAGIMYGAQVESINTVGMLPYGGEGTFNFCGSPFLNEGTDGTENTLGDISVNEDFDYSLDAITFFNSQGDIEFTATYISADVAEENSFEDGAGWYDTCILEGEDPIYYNDYALPFGSSFAFNKSTPTAELVFAGEVKFTSSVVSGIGSFNFICNPTGVDLNLGNITVNEDFDYSVDAITVFTAQGDIEFTATYISADVAEENILEDGAGWYDTSILEGEEPIKYDDFLIPAGFGFAFNKATATAALVFPAIQ